jgi:NAD(P)-dependent dehydrogenase (short-subunit alcohol dehydrogenase family)
VTTSPNRDVHPKDFAGTVGVVTGAGSGLGAATAELFASRGASVIVTDRDVDAAPSVADRLVAATLAVNLTGVFLCLRAELRIMERARAGAVVNTASINSYIAHERTVAYSASKAGVLGLTRAAALEQAGNDVRVNAVCPGWMETPMTRDSRRRGRDVLDSAAKIVSLGRVADPPRLRSSSYGSRPLRLRT